MCWYMWCGGGSLCCSVYDVLSCSRSFSFSLSLSHPLCLSLSLSNTHTHTHSISRSIRYTQINSKDWAGAAAGMKASLWCRQVGSRCTEDAAAVAAGC